MKPLFIWRTSLRQELVLGLSGLPDQITEAGDIVEVVEVVHHESENRPAIEMKGERVKRNQQHTASNHL